MRLFRHLAVAAFGVAALGASERAEACNNPAVAATLPQCANAGVQVNGMGGFIQNNLSPPGPPGMSPYDIYMQQRGWEEQDRIDHLNSILAIPGTVWPAGVPLTHGLDEYDFGPLAGRDGVVLKESAADLPSTSDLFGSGGPDAVPVATSGPTLQVLTKRGPGEFRGGSRVAVGDINGDGTPDTVVDSGGNVQVFDGKTQAPDMSFWAGQRFYRRKDVHITDFFYMDGGDINGDTVPDILVLPASGGAGGNAITFFGPDRGAVINGVFVGGVGGPGSLFGSTPPPDPLSPGASGLFGPDTSFFGPDGNFNGTLLPPGGGAVIADGPGRPAAPGGVSNPPSGGGTQTATAAPQPPPLTGRVKNSDGSDVTLYAQTGTGDAFKVAKLHVVRTADGKLVALNGKQQSFGEVEPNADAPGGYAFKGGQPTPPAPDAPPVQWEEGKPVNAPAQPAGGAQGGGIAAPGGTVTIQNSTVSGNQAQPQGGGIRTAGPAPTVGNSTISGNQVGAASGGGIFNQGPAPTLRNTTISSNAVGPDTAFPATTGSTASLPNLFAPGPGGGIFVSSPMPVNVTIIDTATGKPMLSPTGREVCDPCTFVPGAGGGTAAVDMPTLIRAAGGQPSSPNFFTIITPANGGGVAVADQVANTPRPGGAGFPGVGEFQIIGGR
jgi:hypothetical protein